MLDLKNRSKDDKVTFDDLMISRSDILRKWVRNAGWYNEKCEMDRCKISEVPSIKDKIGVIIDKSIFNTLGSKKKIINIQLQLDEIDKKFAELGYGYQNWKWDIEDALKYRILSANRTPEQIEIQIKESGKQIREKIIRDIDVLIDLNKKYQISFNENNLDSGNNIFNIKDVSNKTYKILESSNDFSINTLIIVHTDSKGCIESIGKYIETGMNINFNLIGLPLYDAHFYTEGQLKNININDYMDYSKFFIDQLENIKENFASVLDVRLYKLKSTILPKGAISVTYSPNGLEKACFEGDFRTKRLDVIDCYKKNNHEKDVITYSNHSHAFEFENGKLKSQKDYLGNWTEISKKEF